MQFKQFTNDANHGHTTAIKVIWLPQNSLPTEQLIANKNRSIISLFLFNFTEYFIKYNFSELRLG